MPGLESSNLWWIAAGGYALALVSAMVPWVNAEVAMHIVAMTAGALDVAFGRFLVVGTFGRLVHFGLVAFIPQLVWRTV